MRNLLEMIYEYQRLRAKERALGIELDDGERVRLMGLMQLLSGKTADPNGRRAMPRVKLPLAIQFTMPGGFESGQIEDVSGQGVGIATRRPPDAGTRVIVRVTDAAQAHEYVFPCRVVWTSARRMGLAYDGVPHKTELEEGEQSGIWRRSMRLGPVRRNPMVA